MITQDTVSHMKKKLQKACHNIFRKMISIKGSNICAKTTILAQSGCLSQESLVPIAFLTFINKIELFVHFELSTSTWYSVLQDLQLNGTYMYTNTK